LDLTRLATEITKINSYRRKKKNFTAQAEHLRLKFTVEFVEWFAHAAKRQQNCEDVSGQWKLIAESLCGLLKNRKRQNILN